MLQTQGLRVALVHDYLKEFGGAERVLRVLAEMWPEAPIYTAFMTPGSSAADAFADRRVIEWKHSWLLRYKNLHSPLRFLIPMIWESFDFSEYDVVISSASGYVTKGLVTHPGTIHICYCHTPPRFLYGYPTAQEWQKWWPVKIYGQILIHHLRQYDFWAAQRPDVMLANSEAVRQRILKFYRRDAEVVYPPVEVGIKRKSVSSSDKGYFLMVSRLVGGKGLEMALEAQRQLGFRLKIVGEKVGLRVNERRWEELTGSGVEWVGRVPDEELADLYAGADAYLALAEAEDFGMTVVEAMACGTPVVAYAGGGYLETVVAAKQGKERSAGGRNRGATGVFFHEYTTESLVETLKKFDARMFEAKDCMRQAEKFSRQVFEHKMFDLVEKSREM